MYPELRLKESQYFRRRLLISILIVCGAIFHGCCSLGKIKVQTLLLLVLMLNHLEMCNEIEHYAVNQWYKT